MKTKLILTLIIVASFACKKENATISLENKNLFYRLSIINKDNSIQYSPIAKTKTTTEIPQSSNGDVDSGKDGEKEKEDENDCNKHKGEARCTVTPVVLEYFDVVQDNNSVKVTWKAAMEYDINYYILERAEDGVTFKAISKIDPKGANIEYQYTDK
jgi:hypothetical protein